MRLANARAKLRTGQVRVHAQRAQFNKPPVVRRTDELTLIGGRHDPSSGRLPVRGRPH